MNGLGSRHNHPTLIELRGHVNELNWELGKLLAERSQVVETIHLLKKDEDLPQRDRTQENTVIASIIGSHRKHGGKYTDETLKTVAQAVIDGHEAIATSIRCSADDGDWKDPRD